MKTIISTLIAVVGFLVTATGQSPNSFKYQTVVRDSSGEIIADQQVNITLSILQGSAGGIVVCTEEFTTVTNDFGLVNLQIGSVNPAAFAAIDWANGPYFTKVELDGNVMGISQLLSVPYALYSERTGFTYEAGAGIQIEENIISTNMNLNTSATGDTLFLMPGNYVIIPGISASNTDNAVVTTNLITAVSSNTAVCGYTVLLYSGPEITARGVCWDTGINPTISGNHTEDGTGPGTFNSTITGLEPNTTYFVRAFATNSAGTTYGELKNFTTSGQSPAVITGDVAGITAITAVVPGFVIYEGSGSVTERGICWGTSPDPTITGNKIMSGSGTGSFNVILSLLVPNTNYHVRAYATSSFSTSYGENMPFTTSDGFYEGFESGFPGGWTGEWSLTSSQAFERYYALVAPDELDSISFTKSFVLPGQVSFYYLGGYDSWYGTTCATSLYLDGVEIQVYSDPNWTQHSITVSPGTHTFTWKNVGGGAGWACIDYIICTEQ
jgi:hypothetical protein